MTEIEKVLNAKIDSAQEGIVLTNTRIDLKTAEISLLNQQIETLKNRCNALEAKNETL